MLNSIDTTYLHWGLEHRSPALDAAVTAFTNIGTTALSLPLATPMAFLLTAILRSWSPVLTVAMAAAVSTSTTTIIKAMVGRARPEHSLAVPPYEHSFSFPSGHTLNATVLALVLGYFCARAVQRRWVRGLIWAAALCYALCMGVSRIFLAHHWSTDVLAGWVFGAIIAGAALALVEGLTRRGGHLPVPLAAPHPAR
ncbi:phosphatase PAP2 family protein [Corynebacterium ciconiae]|uniref:phosphatase PAP2 family protein n=1 Tax=Corynebacterium ciconiae TaxID=227319 RepID=UPI00035D8834|nr:phosphatase PAP2 family protein [Corynebacterium ciconiae]